MCVSTIHRSLLLLLSAGLLAGCLAHGRWPTYSGELAAVSVQEPIRVDRDAYGVPHISAQREADAWFALGFVHGQDRLYQADYARRVVFGGLAEWLGDEAVQHDAFMQSMRLRARAVEVVRHASPEVQGALGSYAAGMNAAAASMARLPPEYRSLHAEWEPWAPSDSVGVLYLHAWEHAENPAAELDALRTRATVAELDRSLRVDRNSPGIELYWDRLRATSLGELTPSFEAFWDRAGHVRAPVDEAWAVGPKRAEAGQAMLALTLREGEGLSGRSYPVTLRGGELELVGLSLPGTPVFLAGQNPQLAWALSGGVVDTVDLAILSRQGARGVLVEGRPSAIEQREVAVRTPEGTRSVSVPWTELGPVITDPSAPSVAVLRWSALSVADRTLDRAMALVHSTSAQEALALGAVDSVLTQELVAVDAQGHFGWTLAGSSVRRRGFSGRLPYPASEARFAWQGWLDDPQVELDSATSLILRAGQRPDISGAGARTASYAPPSRFERAMELLGARERHSWASVAAAQLRGSLADDTSPPSARVIATPAGSSFTLSMLGGPVGLAGHPWQASLREAHEAGRQVPLRVFSEQDVAGVHSSLTLVPPR